LTFYDRATLPSTHFEPDTQYSIFILLFSLILQELDRLSRDLTGKPITETVRDIKHSIETAARSGKAVGSEVSELLREGENVLRRRVIGEADDVEMRQGLHRVVDKLVDEVEGERVREIMGLVAKVAHFFFGDVDGGDREGQGSRGTGNDASEGRNGEERCGGGGGGSSVDESDAGDRKDAAAAAGAGEEASKVSSAPTQTISLTFSSSPSPQMTLPARSSSAAASTVSSSPFEPSAAPQRAAGAAPTLAGMRGTISDVAAQADTAAAAEARGGQSREEIVRKTAPVKPGEEGRPSSGAKTIGLGTVMQALIEQVGNITGERSHKEQPTGKVFTPGAYDRITSADLEEAKEEMRSDAWVAGVHGKDTAAGGPRYRFDRGVRITEASKNANIAPLAPADTNLSAQQQQEAPQKQQQQQQKPPLPQPKDRAIIQTPANVGAAPPLSATAPHPGTTPEARAEALKQKSALSRPELLIAAKQSESHGHPLHSHEAHELRMAQGAQPQAGETALRKPPTPEGLKPPSDLEEKQAAVKKAEAARPPVISKEEADIVSRASQALAAIPTAKSSETPHVPFTYTATPENLAAGRVKVGEVAPTRFFPQGVGKYPEELVKSERMVGDKPLSSTITGLQYQHGNIANPVLSENANTGIFSNYISASSVHQLPPHARKAWEKAYEISQLSPRSGKAGIDEWTKENYRNLTNIKDIGTQAFRETHTEASKKPPQRAPGAAETPAIKLPPSPAVPATREPIYIEEVIAKQLEDLAQRRIVYEVTSRNLTTEDIMDMMKAPDGTRRTYIEILDKINPDAAQSCIEAVFIDTETMSRQFLPPVDRGSGVREIEPHAGGNVGVFRNTGMSDDKERGILSLLTDRYRPEAAQAAADATKAREKAERENIPVPQGITARLIERREGSIPARGASEATSAVASINGKNLGTAFVRSNVSGAIEASKDYVADIIKKGEDKSAGSRISKIMKDLNLDADFEDGKIDKVVSAAHKKKLSAQVGDAVEAGKEMISAGAEKVKDVVQEGVEKGKETMREQSANMRSVWQSLQEEVSAMIEKEKEREKESGKDKGRLHDAVSSDHMIPPSVIGVRDTAKSSARSMKVEPVDIVIRDGQIVAIEPRSEEAAGARVSPPGLRDGKVAQTARGLSEGLQVSSHLLSFYGQFITYCSNW